MPQAHFQHADVMSWASLSTAFETVFEQAGRLDCVLATAGVVNETELGSDDGDHDSDLMPIDTAPIAVNLEGVIQTSHLARHYFLRSPHRGRGAPLLIDASARGLYTGGFAPVYTASKAGVIHFMRSIAGSLSPSRGIRVHAICPNPVWTPIVYTNKVATSLSECFVPMEIIVSVVRLLLEETSVCDSAGKHVALAQKFGLVVEISTTGFYIRDGQEFPDAAGNLSSTLLSTLQKTQAEWR